MNLYYKGKILTRSKCGERTSIRYKSKRVFQFVYMCVLAFEWAYTMCIVCVIVWIRICIGATNCECVCMCVLCACYESVRNTCVYMDMFTCIPAWVVSKHGLNMYFLYVFTCVCVYVRVKYNSLHTETIGVCRKSIRLRTILHPFTLDFRNLT